MSSENAGRLAAFINQLPFAEPVMSESSPDGTKIQVICRVKKGAEQQWAKVVEKVLRKAESEEFQAHVCRLYFLKNDTMVYGWHVGITSSMMGAAVEQVIEAVAGPKRVEVKTPRGPANGRKATMSNYSPPLEADVKGNPIIKGRQVMEMAFTGMEGRKDRNMPSPPNEDGRGGGRGVTKIS